MTEFNALIETTTRGTDENIDRLMGALAPWHVSLSGGPGGRIVASITLPAEDLRQAALTALAVVVQAGVKPTAILQLMETEEFHRRAKPVPTNLRDVIGTEDAAQILGRTQARVKQLVAEGRLPHGNAGRTTVLSRMAVEQLKEDDPKLAR